MKILQLAFGAILLAAGVMGGLVGISGSGSEQIEVPSCSTNLLQGVNFCDKSAMMDQDIPVPAVVGELVSASFSVKLDKADAWVGIVDAGEASKCSPTGQGYLSCDTKDLEFIVGGPDSQGGIEWSVEGGEYRFVGGNSAEGSAQTTTVDYEYSAALTPFLTYPLIFAGIGLIAWGLIKK